MITLESTVQDVPLNDHIFHAEGAEAGKRYSLSNSGIAGERLCGTVWLQDLSWTLLSALGLKVFREAVLGADPARAAFTQLWFSMALLLEWEKGLLYLGMSIWVISIFWSSGITPNVILAWSQAPLLTAIQFMGTGNQVLDFPSNPHLKEHLQASGGGQWAGQGQLYMENICSIIWIVTKSH